MQWISVKDKLPPPEKKVIITDGENIDVGELWADVYGCFVETQEFMPWREVTHWAPLPLLPHENNVKEDIKITERGFEILCLLAFRYAINRHGTQCMTRGAGNGDTIESIVLSNLEHINANFKCQMMNDILNEFRMYDDLEGEESKWGSSKKIPYSNGDGYFWRESPHYLDRMFNALKEDYKATHGYEWQEGVQI